MDYDPLLGAIVIFGGDDHGTAMGDTWEWKSNVWTRLNNLSITPPGRYDSTMAYDPGVGAVVLFGGSYCPSVACSDTWEFNGTWSEVHTNSSPIERAWFGMTYDPLDGYLLLFGGQSPLGGYHGLNDSWEFNGTDWIRLHSPNAPPREQQVVLAYDPVGREVVDFPLGTTATWIFAHGHWTNVSSKLAAAPPNRGLPAMASDPVDGYVLMFGGASGTASHSQIGNCPPCRNDTWAWRGLTARLYTTIVGSPQIVDAGMTVHFSDPAVFNGHWPWTYHWNFGDGTTGAGRNVTHVYATPGVFDAVVFVNDSAGRSANASMEILVNARLSVVAVSELSKTDVGYPFNFSAALTGGTAPFDYAWNFGDGNTSTTSRPSHDYSSGGFYTVWVTVTDQLGRHASSPVSVRADPALALLNLSMKQPSAQIGKIVNFTATFTGGTRAYTFAWNFGDGTRGGNVSKIAHIFLSTGSFLVRVTIRDAVGEVVRGALWVTVT
jgi:PKD repeat protein